MNNIYRAAQSVSYTSILPSWCPPGEGASSCPGFRLADGDLLRPSLVWALDWPQWGDSTVLLAAEAHALGIRSMEIRIAGGCPGGEFDLEARINTDLPPFYERGYPAILGFRPQDRCGVLRTVPALERVNPRTGEISQVPEAEWEHLGVTVSTWTDADIDPEMLCAAIPFHDHDSLPSAVRTILLLGAMRS